MNVAPPFAANDSRPLRRMINVAGARRKRHNIRIKKIRIKGMSLAGQVKPTAREGIMARILLVEDEADLRENIEIVLRHNGHEVTGAGDGRQALAAIAQAKPDILITDISMPVMDGVALVRTVRETMPGLADMPIILLTALGDKEHMIDGRGAGADEYLTKPIDYQILNAVINARLSRARQELDLKEKQFVRLFKELSANASRNEPAEIVTAPPDPLDKIRLMSPPSLQGRLAILHLEEHIPSFADLPAAVQTKALNVMRRVLSDGIGPGDAAVELATGACLLAFADQDRETVDAKCALLGLRLDHALGAENLVEGAPVADREHADELKIDGETRSILKKLFAGGAEDDGGPLKLHGDFPAVAGQFQFDYLPIWHVGSQRIGAYQLRWRRRCDSGALLGRHALLGGFADPMAGDLTCLAMEAAAQELRALEAQPAMSGGMPFIIVPVAENVLSGDGGQKLLNKLGELGKCREKSRLGFLLRRMETQGTDDRSVALTAALSAVSKLIFRELDGDRLPSAEAGQAMTYVDAGIAERTAHPREAVRSALLETIRHAAKQGANIWVTNVDNSQTARMTAAAGAHFLSGKCVGAARTAPDRPKKTPAGQVFMTL
jgi:CheY-like chemotaxis protein